MTKISISAAVLAALTLTGVAASHAEPIRQRSYTSLQAISHSFGSKRAVGYFASEGGACAVTMFLAEAEEGHEALSASRVKVTVRPGEKVELASGEGEGIAVTCGKDASAVELSQTRFSSPALTTATVATTQ